VLGYVAYELHACILIKSGQMQWAGANTRSTGWQDFGAALCFLFQFLMPASYPPYTCVCGGAYAIPELSHVMLQVPKTNELMFYFGDFVPEEATVRIGKVERINTGIDRAIANVPIGQHFFLCVWFSRPGRTVRQFANTRAFRRAFLVIHELNTRLVMLPWTERIRVRLEIEMRVIQHMISDPPKRVEIIAAGPQCVGTSLYRVSKHCEGGVILALEDGTHHFDCIHDSLLIEVG
jgi:hypothetical protein